MVNQLSKHQLFSGPPPLLGNAIAVRDQISIARVSLSGLYPVTQLCPPQPVPHAEFLKLREIMTPGKCSFLHHHVFVNIALPGLSCFLFNGLQKQLAKNCS